MSSRSAAGGDAVTDSIETSGRSARTLPRGGEAPGQRTLDEVDRGLGELVDDDRRARASRSRRAAGLRRVVEQDTATFVGVLRDHAEQGVDLLVEHDGGRLAGRIVGLGEDHVVIEARGGGRRSVIRLDAIIAMTADRARRAPEPRGRRQLASGPVLREVLVGAMEQRVPLRAHLAGRAEAVGGIPMAVGEDQLTLRVDAAIRLDMVVPLRRVVRVDLAG